MNQKSRQLQIQALLKKFPNTGRTPDPNVFIIQPKSLKGLKLLLTLPQNFPTGRPELRLVPGLRVAEWKYCDNRGQICHSRLMYWGINNNLGKVMEQIVNDMRKNSPKILSQPQPIQQQPQIKSYPTKKPLNPPRKDLNRFEEKVEEYHIPNVPDSFPQLENLNDQELQQLLTSPDHLNSFMENLPYKRTITQLIDDIEKNNMKTATEKVEKDAKLRQQIQELNQKKNQLEQLQNHYASLKTQQNEIKAKFAPQAILQLLNQSIHEIEQESEEMAEKFEEEGGNLTQFLQAYRKKRELFHLRKQKQIQFEQKFVKNQQQFF